MSSTISIATLFGIFIHSLTRVPCLVRNDVAMRRLDEIEFEQNFSKSVNEDNTIPTI